MPQEDRARQENIDSSSGHFVIYNKEKENNQAFWNK